MRNLDDVKYLTDGYAEKIARIKSIAAPINFIFITDIHNRLAEMEITYNKRDIPLPALPAAIYAVRSMHYILERCPEIGFAVCGGDIGNDYDPDPAAIKASYREVMAELYDLPVPVHCCIGNHDDVTGEFRKGTFGNMNYGPEYVVLPEELHEICMKNCPTDQNYYYIDQSAGGLDYRFVFLNTSDKAYFQDKTTGLYPDHYEISVKQALWLENEALNTDRKIIVFSHCPIKNEGIFGSGTFRSPIRPYDDVFNAPRVYHALKECKNVVALIAGHVHFDNLHFDGDLPTITTLCSLVQQWSPACPSRQWGKPTETAFDVFSIKGNTLYITRFGAGEDRAVPLLRG